VAKLLSRPSRPPPPAPPTTRAPPRPAPPAKVSVTVSNGTTRQGLAAKTTAGLRKLGFKAANGGNAGPAGRTILRHPAGKEAAAAAVARAGKAGRPVRPTADSGLDGGTVELVLGADFRGLASRAALKKKSKPPPTRPPAPTRATRDLPAWDPRPC
jgi:hypothetical protein